VAGAAVEFDLPDQAVGALMDGVAIARRESPGELAVAVGAHRAPAAALRLGEATLAAREAPDADDRRLDREAARYRGALARELRR
jgi:hypothetical protein